jgi:hypothetical protein
MIPLPLRLGRGLRWRPGAQTKASDMTPTHGPLECGDSARYLSLPPGCTQASFQPPFTLLRGAETVAVAPDLASAANEVLQHAELASEVLDVVDGRGQRVAWGY